MPRDLKKRAMKIFTHKMLKGGAVTALSLGLCAGIVRGINEVEFFFGEEETPNTAIPSATVKTDSEMEALLQRAGQFAAQERYDLASILWQQVIDRSSDVVFTREEWITRTLQHQYQKYRGITSDIEHTLATLPPLGLEGYRLKADGEAKAILLRAGSEGREAALAEVVRRYFISSQGDDAAFELACLKLDRFEFLPAARLLIKLRNEYPDSNIEKKEVTVRLLAANARVGDIAGARKLLAELRESDMDSAKVELVVADLEVQARKLTMVASDSSAVGGWKMPFGNAARSGLMPDVPANVASAASLGIDWEQTFNLRLPEGWPELPLPDIDPYSSTRLRPSARVVQWNQFNNGNAPKPVEPEKPPTLVEQWTREDLMPTGQAIVDGDRVFFKTHFRTVCCDLKTGEVKWLGFRNTYPMDAHTLNSLRYMAYGAGGDSMDMEATELFLDQVHQSMTLAGDLLLNFQGEPSDFSEEREDNPQDIQQRMQFGNFGVPGTTRTRSNRLVAYHATSGKMRWLRHESDGQFDAGLRVSFAGSAVPYGSMLLVPVHHDTALWVYAMDAKTGKTLWRSFLANEPGDYCSANSPVSLAVEGGDAYVASGAGLIFSIDAISGALNWAVAYQRSATVPEENNNRRFQAQMNQADNLDGWNEDVVIPYGQTLIFAGSDYDALAAFDRRTGDLLWESSRIPVIDEPANRYVLGVHQGCIYVAGDRIVRAYKANGGRLLWETPVDRSFARGIITDGGLFIPQEKHIAHLDLKSGDVIARIPVEQPGEGESEPVGNLFSTGEGFLIFGSKRIYTLDPVEALKSEELETEEPKSEE